MSSLIFLDELQTIADETSKAFKIIERWHPYVFSYYAKQQAVTEKAIATLSTLKTKLCDLSLPKNTDYQLERIMEMNKNLLLRGIDFVMRAHTHQKDEILMNKITLTQHGKLIDQLKDIDSKVDGAIDVIETTTIDEYDGNDTFNEKRYHLEEAYDRISNLKITLTEFLDEEYSPSIAEQQFIKDLIYKINNQFIDKK